MSETDKILVLLKQGDKAGLELLFRKFYNPLVMYATKYVSDVHEAEDLVQDVFINFWEGNKFNSIHSYIRSFLYQSVKNRCLNHNRSQERVKMDYIENDQYKIFDSFPDENDFQEKLMLINQEIDALPERTKEIFIAVHLHGMSYKEIASDLDVSVNTVKTTLSRALRTLKQRLKPEVFAILLTII